MSKQKNTDLSETENEVKENLVEQSELEGLSSVKEKVVESVPKVSDTAKSTAINRIPTASVKANRRMGVSKFLSYYPQNYFIEAILRYNYPTSYFTVEEWFMRIDELMNQPVLS